MDKVSHENELLRMHMMVHAHINMFIEQIASRLRQRGYAHDTSSLYGDEFEPEVRAMIESDKKRVDYGIVDHLRNRVWKLHTSNNTHHLKDEVKGMTLLDLLEFLADWRSARMLPMNNYMPDNADSMFHLEDVSTICEEHHISSQVKELIVNTLKELGWLGQTTTG